MSEAVRGKRPEAEAAPPVRAKCPFCGWDGSLAVYTVPIPEAGVRQVTRKCGKCGERFWYQEKMVEASER